QGRDASRYTWWLRAGGRRTSRFRQGVPATAAGAAAASSWRGSSAAGQWPDPGNRSAPCRVGERDMTNTCRRPHAKPVVWFECIKVGFAVIADDGSCRRLSFDTNGTSEWEWIAVCIVQDHDCRAYRGDGETNAGAGAIAWRRQHVDVGNMQVGRQIHRVDGKLVALPGVERRDQQHAAGIGLADHAVFQLHRNACDAIGRHEGEGVADAAGREYASGHRDETAARA